MRHEEQKRGEGHKRTKAKIQVNNFIAESSDDDVESVNDVINIMPQLLHNDQEKKIICDYDDISVLEDDDTSLNQSDHHPNDSRQMLLRV